jgi:UDP-N-acetylmuramoyl-L-alanyl-D-glutamate--2,6-diaminopimelate ligase
MKKYNNIIELLESYNISDIELDSRKISTGAAFFALQGISSDGNDYIEQALQNGAVVIISDKISNEEKNIYKVEDAKLALAKACSWFYPNIPSKLLAVTGTSGKSSVVSYIMQIFELLHVPAASIGSLGIVTNKCANGHVDSGALDLNTQDLPTFYKTLSDLKSKNIDIVSFEASSHGLDQSRMLGVQVQAVGFTSFSQDHLDYHGDMENYIKAKLKIFSNNLVDNGIAIINSDMDCTKRITDYVKTLGKSLISVGLNGDLKIINIDQSIDKQKIEFIYNNENYHFETKVIGSFQASNILIAAILVLSCGYDFDKIVKVLPCLNIVSGRLEKVQVKQHIFVDHSHKPGALEKALLNLASLKKQGSKLLVVFGCGGNRDKLKRPIMGRLASEIADIIIVTDDNPRFEEPETIRQEILAGIQDLSKVTEIGNRREAIKYAISIMGEEDILLIAGKGHETYQLIKDQKVPFSDIEVAKDLSGGK